MAAVHSSGLPALEYELVGRARLVRMRTELLFWQVEGHDRSAKLVRRLEFVQVRRRESVPGRELAIRIILFVSGTGGGIYHPAVYERRNLLFLSSNPSLIQLANSWS